MRVSIVIPALDEAERIEAHLTALAWLRQRGGEIMVVDGGSSDGTAEKARGFADCVLDAPRGRAIQMNAGAGVARGEILLFLHADTQLPPEADRLVAEAIQQGATWGRFDVRIEGDHPMLRIVARSMNWRSRLTGIATGDQAIFVRRDIFEGVGGFPDIPLMEDIELSRRLKQGGRPLCVAERVSTSGRRWEKHGLARTILLMWRLRTAYFLGADPRGLANRYGYSARND